MNHFLHTSSVISKAKHLRSPTLHLSQSHWICCLELAVYTGPELPYRHCERLNCYLKLFVSKIVRCERLDCHLKTFISRVVDCLSQVLCLQDGLSKQDTPLSIRTITRPLRHPEEEMGWSWQSNQVVKVVHLKGWWTRRIWTPFRFCAVMIPKTFWLELEPTKPQWDHCYPK